MNHANIIISKAEVDASRLAVRFGQQTLTYGELVAESEALSIGLRRAGINKTDRVMMYAENSIEHLVVYHALARIGAIFAPVHPDFRAQELDYAISNAQPKLIITSAQLLPAVESALQKASLRSEIVISCEEGVELPLETYRKFSDLRSEAGKLPPEDLEPDHPLLICYTSGTSSLPKPVLRSHGSETWSAQRYSESWGFTSDDSILVAMSLSWVYGLSSLCQTALATGATVVIDKKFSPTRTLELMHRGEVTAFAGTTSMYSMMLNILQERSFDTASMRKLFLGGEPRNETVISQIESRFGLRLCEGWAMTESFPVLAIHPQLDLMAPSASLGRAVADVEIRLVDESGMDVAEGEPGEALVRSQGDFLGYYNEPGLTEERRTKDGWIRTGDFLSRSADGYFKFVSRKSELIIRGGVNISPAEIESAICEHPDVSDAIVVGLPDQVLGEVVTALITTCAGKTVNEVILKEFLELRIAKFKVPAFIISIDEIPRGTTGKKNRAKAKEIAVSVQP